MERHHHLVAGSLDHHSAMRGDDFADGARASGHDGMGAHIAKQPINARAASNIRKQEPDFAVSGQNRSKIKPPELTRHFLRRN